MRCPIRHHVLLTTMKASQAEVTTMTIIQVCEFIDLRIRLNSPQINVDESLTADVIVEEHVRTKVKAPRKRRRVTRRASGVASGREKNEQNEIIDGEQIPQGKSMVKEWNSYFCCLW